MKLKKVLIVGTGITALTLAKLLSQANWQVTISKPSIATGPTLVLQKETYQLIQELWSSDQSFLHFGHAIEGKQVIWDTPNPVFLKENGYLVNSQTLKSLLWNTLLKENKIQVIESFITIDATIRQNYTWIIDASGRKAAIGTATGGHRIKLGQRRIFSTEVVLNQKISTTWVEKLDNNWLFLAPISENKAILQTMLPQFNTSTFNWTIPLKSSRFIAQLIQNISPSTVNFEASPAITYPLVQQNVISIGDAAMSLDPLCGDGTGYGIRGAILVNAILNRIDQTPEQHSQNYWRHYQQRLAKAFFTHIEGCLKFYYPYARHPLWKQEFQQMLQPLPQDFERLAMRRTFDYHIKNGVLMAFRKEYQI